VVVCKKALHEIMMHDMKVNVRIKEITLPGNQSGWQKWLRRKRRSKKHVFSFYDIEKEIIRR
jgi:hypothetical protein